ncbi:pentatricopeptide repeat-containing protein At3g51320-like [Mercurialis annua]|uniref:pentatricopeptide repeat-containing protein At3g51320-like n=1 Tax=Mercurialis annua TaxID=3986 RepID=UPI00215EA6FE|nr:pentatricopeptide repeat-containing protein At3g51320-like [Mercurialis annua]
MASVRSGEQCHRQGLKNGVEYILPVQNSLTHIYGCCGHVEFARKINNTRRSLMLFRKMGIYGLRGDNTTMENVLTACCKSSMFERTYSKNVAIKFTEKNYASYGDMVNNLRSFETTQDMWNYLKHVYHQDTLHGAFNLNLRLATTIKAPKEALIGLQEVHEDTRLSF